LFANKSQDVSKAFADVKHKLENVQIKNSISEDPNCFAALNINLSSKNLE